ncbi:Glycosyl hydrolases family 43 [compost metagenome]
MRVPPVYLVVLHKTIYTYERALLRALLEHAGDNCAIYILEAEHPPFKKNAILSFIDRRLLTFKVLALESCALEDTLAAYPRLRRYEEGMTAAGTYVISLTERVLEALPLTFRKAYRPEIDKDHWYDAAIRKEQYTNVRLSSRQSGYAWETCHELSFATVRGIYNNLDKALYYLTYLVLGQIKDNPHPVHLLMYPSYTLTHLIIYYLRLCIFLFMRKLCFWSGKYNWKIALIRQEEVSFIGQPAKSFWADPFLVREGGANFIFFEEMDQHTGKGHISVIMLDENGQSSGKPSKALIQPFHLSFPNVFKREGQYYMMPEQSSSGRLSIYKAVQFPHVWVEEMVMIEGMNILDPLWLFHEGKYWLFFNKIEEYEYDNNERLYIYYSDSLFSNDWKPHKKNPVIIDMHKARNAGQIYSKEGELYRPSQNCGATYGSEIMINRIVKLSEEEYEEESVEQLSRYNKYYGMHTFNGDEQLQVIDLLVKG